MADGVLLQTLALSLSEAANGALCQIEVRTDAAALGSAASLWLELDGRMIDQPLTQFVSRESSSEVSSGASSTIFEYAEKVAQEAAIWLQAQGWKQVGSGSVKNAQATLWRFVYDAPSRLPDSVTQARVGPYLGALKAKTECLLVHEYEYSSRGGLSLADEVLLRWGTQSRALRSADAAQPEALARLFMEGEAFAEQAAAWLTQNGWKFTRRERQWQRPEALSNSGSTSITITRHFERKKRFGLF